LLRADEKTYELVTILNKSELLWGKTFWILVTGLRLRLPKIITMQQNLKKMADVT
jgi:hypothetical protein